MVFTKISSREGVNRVLQAISVSNCQCPAHSHGHFGNHGSHRPTSSTNPTKEYAFEMATSSLRYGHGVTREIGKDLEALGLRHICVMTDPNVSKLSAMRSTIESLTQSKVGFEVFDKVRVEPTDTSLMEAITFARRKNFDGYVAVGGGSVMDTCKAANLYATNPNADFLDYVNAPIGKGLPVTHKLKPLFAIPTTAGTGSETTGVAIFDFEKLHAKTGIANRALRPTLGLVDPDHVATMPERVAAFSACDVLCHALESYTALPYYERPCPPSPAYRPAYQGSNPLSDVWSRHTLHLIAKYMIRSVFNPSDKEARSNMHLASSMAGVGFGNAGVHLCHGMSYAIAGNVKTYHANHYPLDHPMVPHGLSVVITAPAVFAFTAPSAPERHLECAEILGADVRNVRKEDSGRVLADTLKKYMSDLKIEDGLKALGYSYTDIPALVKSTLPQQRVLTLSPRPQTEDDLTKLFENALTVY